MCPGGLPATGGVPVGVLTARSRRLFVSGARVDFKSELNSSRVPAGPKNSPVAAGCTAGPRVKEAVYIRAHRPTLNRDGGRHKFSGTYDPLLRSRVSDVTFQE
ncbi:hypothetical protein Bbelb_210550 [Branchiostoma belcheri]|nr:hypothetical protein Bbelb_210550 [Branchiostoma belcheri]